MDVERMQRLIDRGDRPEIMNDIALGYLDGAVLRDPVAAEAWLMKAIEAGDPRESPRAMAVLARRILGRGEILTDEDYLDIRSRAETAGEAEGELLDALLELASDRQKRL